VCVYLYLIEGLCVCVSVYLNHMGASLELLEGNILPVCIRVSVPYRGTVFVCIHVSVL